MTQPSMTKPSAPKTPQATIVDVSQTTFAQEVISRSLQGPVIVAFYAAWSQASTELIPRLETAVNQRNGDFTLAKVDIDHNKILASQLGIQSVPVVYIFLQGQPVTGFNGPQSQETITQFLDSVAQQLGLQTQPDPSQADSYDQILAKAEHENRNGQFAQAHETAQALIAQDPQRHEAHALMLQLLLQQGQLDACQQTLDALSTELKKHEAITACEKRLGIARTLEAALKTHPEITKRAPESLDPVHDAQLLAQVALYRFSVGQEQEAISFLLRSLDALPPDQRREHPAKHALIDLLNALGFDNPLAASARKKLTFLLFS